METMRYREKTVGASYWGKPEYSNSDTQLKAMHAAARTVGLQIHVWHPNTESRLGHGLCIPDSTSSRCIRPAVGTPAAAAASVAGHFVGKLAS